MVDYAMIDYISLISELVMIILEISFLDYFI